MYFLKYFFFFLLLSSYGHTYGQAIHADYAVFLSSEKETMEKALQQMIIKQKNATVQMRHIVLMSDQNKLNANTIHTLAQELHRKKKTLARFLERCGKETSDQLTQSDLWKYIWDMKVSRSVKKKYIHNHHLFLIEHAYHPNEDVEKCIEHFFTILKPKGYCYFFLTALQMEKIQKKIKNIQAKYPETICHFYPIKNLT